MLLVFVGNAPTDRYVAAPPPTLIVTAVLLERAFDARVRTLHFTALAAT
jgi:hypothetical protein